MSGDRQKRPCIRGAGHVALRGGERIAIRPVQPGDKALLRAAFERLGPESR